jgi:transmembrane 9 superfamily protein 2/4
MLLSVFLGSGAQIFFMSIITVFFAALGLLAPGNRGSLMTTIIVVFVLFGLIAGYTSARYYKMFGGENWKRNVLVTAFLVPG